MSKRLSSTQVHATFSAEVVLGTLYVLLVFALLAYLCIRKTTTMLFKMLGIERAYDDLRAEYGSELSRPRQLFVTQSRILAEKVQEFYVKLAMSQAAAKRTAEENSKFASQQKAQEEKGLVDRDEEEFHHGTLPKSFKELKDEHFPLFVTFDHVSRVFAYIGIVFLNNASLH